MIFDLWDYFRNFGRGASFSAEEEAAFRKHSVELSANAAQITSMVLAGLTFFAWPTDLMVLAKGSIELSSMVYWRMMTIFLCILVFVFTRYVGFGKRHPVLVMGIALVLGLSGSGYVTALSAGIDGPFFYGVFTAPLMTVLLVVPVVQRAFVTFLAMIFYMVTFFATRPDAVNHPLIGVPFVWLFASTLTAIASGHVLYFLLRINFSQQNMLEDRAHELEALDRAKNKFFANINHELRTPLTNIIGSLRRIMNSDTSDKVRSQSDVSIRNASHLLTLLNDLSALSKLDSGRTTIKKQVVDVAELLRRISGEFDTGLERKIIFTGAIKETDVLAEIDAPQIRIVLYNLLSNAFKFSPAEEKPVTMGLEYSESTLTIVVKDQGIGIEKDKLPHVFERFYQAESDAQRRYEGVGIGLSLVKEIIELHQGKVIVESEIGVGTTFTITLPRGDVEGAAPVAFENEGVFAKPRYSLEKRNPSQDIAPVCEEERLSGKEDNSRPLILVVEDNDDLRSYLCSLLHKFYRVVCAENGLVGLEKARLHRPQLILADIMMPIMSGMDLLKEVRQDKELTNTPCLFLSAVTQNTTKLEALKEGINDYLQKPFDEVELLARIKNLLKLHQFSCHLEELVAEKTQEVQQLTDSLVSLEERERRYIAQEIHDELGQLITGLRMELELLQFSSEESSLSQEQLLSGFAESINLLNMIHESINRILDNLRPRMLDSRGFIAAVKWLISQLEERGKLSCETEVDLEEDRLSENQTRTLYRVIQEAFTNILRHSKARHVSVSLKEQEEDIRLWISDDGVGFIPEEKSIEKGYGLQGMRERVKFLGGTSTLASTLGKGTEIEVSIPLGG